MNVTLHKEGNLLPQGDCKTTFPKYLTSCFTVRPAERAAVVYMKALFCWEANILGFVEEWKILSPIIQK